eukprot:CAMPEP_0119300642 /NCGR_PEP_ID=MMETSP1333-20130426/2562_1 /TAXON_ID=418940 /ORGANISM="Scyphosphaera apsteinii, Strain RCC1455" /LENGTH=374 /DNA_ID=CAMNT_0007302485 /DNA_START=27 /DNA_END=1151 /DNA_ORIENTATION=+
MPLIGSSEHNANRKSRDTAHPKRKGGSRHKGERKIGRADERAHQKCQPPKLATTCICNHTNLPRCVPTKQCGRNKPVFKPRIAGTIFAIIFDHNSSRVRYWFRKDPLKSYLNGMRLITRLVVSLNAVGTQIPIHFFPSGYRHPAYEGQLTSLGVNVSSLMEQPVLVPSWANQHHRGSFSKLRVLALTQHERVILLDQDQVVLRNIDHLSGAPTPSGVFHYVCEPMTELNSGLMVLQPNKTLYNRIFHDPDYMESIVPLSTDQGDQSVWRAVLPFAFALPMGYNPFKIANFKPEHEWTKVHMLHDAWRHRGSGWWSRGKSTAAIFERVEELQLQADRVLDGLPCLGKDKKGKQVGGMEPGETPVFTCATKYEVGG